MTTTTYQALLDQLAADAAGAADQATEADRRLRDAAALVEAKREAGRRADAEARARDRHAADIAAGRHRIAMLDHALHVADLVAAVGPAIDAAEKTARSANMATANGPLATLQDLRPKVISYAARRDLWRKERADTLARLAELERAGPTV